MKSNSQYLDVSLGSDLNDNNHLYAASLDSTCGSYNNSLLTAANTIEFNASSSSNLSSSPLVKNGLLSPSSLNETNLDFDLNLNNNSNLASLINKTASSSPKLNGLNYQQHHHHQHHQYHANTNHLLHEPSQMIKSKKSRMVKKKLKNINSNLEKNMMAAIDASSVNLDPNDLFHDEDSIDLYDKNLLSNAANDEDDLDDDESTTDCLAIQAMSISKPKSSPISRIPTENANNNNNNNNNNNSNTNPNDPMNQKSTSNDSNNKNSAMLNDHNNNISHSNTSDSGPMNGSLAATMIP